MAMLKTAWDEVTEKNFFNYFKKSEISVEAQAGGMIDHVDRFKEIWMLARMRVL